MKKFFIQGARKKLTLLFFVFVSLAGMFFYVALAREEKSKSSVPSTEKSIQAKTDVEKISKKDIKILFVGDMMFDRYIRQATDAHVNNFVFQKVADLFKSNDLVVGNLEGPITDNPSVSVNSEFGSRENYIFTFDPKFAQILKDVNVSLVNIGNNHISNFGDAGIESTHRYLKEAGVAYFGDPQDENARISIQNIGGFKIAFVSYNQFVSDAKQKTLDDIKKTKKENVDYIFLYTHWGKEFMPEPEEKTKNLAHEFIDSGVDLIIGTHPHVIQTVEKYKGKMIYYSLGNFIFDQYFDAKTQQGLAVQINIGTNNKNIIAKEIKVRMKNSGQTILEQ